MKVKSSKPSSDMAPRGKSQGTEYVQKVNCTSIDTPDINKKLSAGASSPDIIAEILSEWDKEKNQEKNSGWIISARNEKERVVFSIETDEKEIYTDGIEKHDMTGDSRLDPVYINQIIDEIVKITCVDRLDVQGHFQNILNEVTKRGWYAGDNEDTDNSGVHLETNNACDRFKPTENSKMNIEELRAINMKNAVVIEKDAEDLEAKNAVLKMVISEIRKHRGEALTVRVELCKTLLKQCGLDAGYAQNICKGVIKEEEGEEGEKRTLKELDERRTLGDGVVFKDDRGALVLDTATFGEQLVERYKIITYGDNRNMDTCTPFVYKDGFYQVGIIQLNKDIAKFASDQYAINNIKRETLDTLHFIRSLTAVSENPFNVKHNAINVNNGVIVFDREKGTYELKEHSPEYRFNYKLPVDFNPDAPDTIHEMCVSQWADEPDELYQIPAQALIQTMNEAPFKKAYLVQGERNAGKSTYLNLLRKVFDGFISGIALQNLNEKVNRFNVANLEGMMFNIYDDLGEIPMDDVGTFKNLTGSYTQNIERKHCGAYMGRVNAVHIYTCNVPPEFNKKIKKDTAFWFRWNLIRFTRYFKTDDRFTDIYTEENMSGFLNHILDMMCRIFKNDGLVYQSDASDVREQWSLSTDVVHMFIEDNIEMGAGEMCVSPDGLQDTLKRYMMANDLDMDKCPTSIRALTDALEKFEIYHERVTTENGKQYVYVIPGKWSICAKFICETQRRKTRQAGITE